MKVAEKEIGVKERKGPADNPRIVEYHSVTTLRAKDDEVPWCSSFVCWVMEQYGITSSKSARARDWLKWGFPLGHPIYGSIVIFDRGHGMGHVGFFLGFNGKKLRILGGNQADAVNVQEFPPEKVLGVRWPDQAPQQ
jgi:uncharacterized protein (TIGR02594 family)